PRPARARRGTEPSARQLRGARLHDPARRSVPASQPRRRLLMEGFRQVLSRAPWAIEPLSALIFTALVAVAFAPLELAFPARRSARDRRSVTTDLLFATIGTAVTRALLFVVLGSSLATVRAASAAVGLGPASPLNDWPGIVRVAV